MNKLLIVTWSYSDVSNLETTRIYKSFIKKNNSDNIINIHFNRKNYIEIEEYFKNKFGYQYEYILYRIFLLKEELKKLPFENIIFSDSDDVVCLDNIENIKISDKKIIFSSEKHQYPNKESILDWAPCNTYQYDNIIKQNYLNAGLSMGKTKTFLLLYENCIDIATKKSYKNFGGDQGIFTYHYINELKPKIFLDYERQYFLNTYSDSYGNYFLSDGKIVCVNNLNKPYFIHDNGWNYGSPKFIEHFKL